MTALERYGCTLELWAKADTMAATMLPIRDIRSGKFDPVNDIRDSLILHDACRWATTALDLKELRESLCEEIDAHTLASYDTVKGWR